ncbi:MULTISPECIES: N-acetylneuraminate synthase [unclassified Viridibacillus]|uniref:N-acetylneuraminate synthase n=1 Tax=unclassified Viridibacillus TaxID=2617942 RepID=UPI00096C7358|nr:N-acetylneuraminate synthase [Viridibacillus sp. FSL H8-0123]OMC81687.1 N-acetylneuraminate synthase [Viridibacillus sp. FSL H8-0123]
MTNTYIIAEAGVNHNGSYSMAKKLVDVAKEAGANAVKFQTFRAENLVTKEAMQADYQVENLGKATSQYEMLKSLELSYEEFTALKSYCDEIGIEFLSTPFDHDSVDFLIEDLQMQTIKIPSGELTNSPFIHYIATKKKKMIISTGMATIAEIHEALSFVAYGLAKPYEEVSIENVQSYYKTNEAKEILQKFVTVLHCTTEYPAPFETINLKAMNQLAEELNLPIGFSDHSQGISVPIAATSMGATIIEKHFTLDRNLPGPDHVASLEPLELSAMIEGIRQIESALGTGLKEPTPIEMKNRVAARKSLVASTDIRQGEILKISNIAVKRPGNGISPSKYWSIIGEKSTKFYKEDEQIDE